MWVVLGVWVALGELRGDLILFAGWDGVMCFVVYACLGFSFVLWLLGASFGLNCLVGFVFMLWLLVWFGVFRFF